MTLEEQRACMETLQLAGQLIVENGGEIFRVEETITRMGRAFGLDEVEAFAVPSGMFISYRLSDGNVETSVKRLRSAGTHLGRVDAVNAVSRRVEREGLSRAQAQTELEAIRGSASLGRWALMGAAGLCAAGFSFLFGGGWAEFLVAGAVAALCQWMADGLSRTRVNGTVLTILGGLISALIPTAAAWLDPSFRADATIAGALMPLLPGLTMTNAVQDTVRGDMMAGLSHGLQALITACAVAGGALLAATAFQAFTGDSQNLALDTMKVTPGLWEILLVSVGAFLGTLGFGALVQTPRRAWAPASLIGVGAYLVYVLLSQLGLNDPASIFFGALAGSLAALVCAKRMRMIGTIFLMLSIVSFVPGLGLYRCMHYLGGGFTTQGGQQGVSAMITITMIVFGQYAGSFLYRAAARR